MEAQRAYTEIRWKHKFDPSFPAANDHYTYCLNCLHDFEYYHGNSTLSKRNLDAKLGIRSGDKGGREDQGGHGWRLLFCAH